MFSFLRVSLVMILIHNNRIMTNTRALTNVTGTENGMLVPCNFLVVPGYS